jgi:hypothetical protein
MVHGGSDLPLPAPGDACGPCGDGVYLCASPRLIACVGASPARTCLAPDASVADAGAWSAANNEEGDASTADAQDATSAVDAQDAGDAASSADVVAADCGPDGASGTPDATADASRDGATDDAPLEASDDAPPGDDAAMDAAVDATSACFDAPAADAAVDGAIDATYAEAAVDDATSDAMMPCCGDADAAPVDDGSAPCVTGDEGCSSTDADAN